MGEGALIATAAATGIALAVGVGWLAWRLHTRRRGWALVLAMLALGMAGAAGWLGWYRFRPWPPALARTVAPGIEVRRFGTTVPRPLLVSVAEIDLSVTGREVVTSAVAADGTIAARTTGQFAREHAAIVAVNAHFFTPFWSKSPWSYYPHVGDPVSPLGLTAADGVIVDHGGWNGATIWFSREGTASISEVEDAPWDAITGRYRLLERGEVVAPPTVELAPRVAVGVGEGGRRIWLVVVDGRQPGFAEGVTLRELAEIVRAEGAEDAVELDGGGSATMVVADEHGGPAVINSPIHTRLPGRERPVATHLGVRDGPAPSR